MTTVWSANDSVSLNEVVAPTAARRKDGLFFRVTSAGTTGSSEPNWPSSVGETVYDNDVQSTNPSAVIELFTLQLDNDLHGATTTYYFHSGSNLNANNKIRWQGVDYLRFPIKAEGFASQRGQLPRPKLTISNATGLISSILLTVNETTTGNDLTGAKVTRIRTFAKFIDASNFADGQNATADPTAESSREIFLIDRKSAENRDVVEFELAAPTDLAGVRIPQRQCTRAEFPGIGTFIQ